MKSTKRDFECFKTAFLHWVNVFGLKSYHVTFEHKHLEDKYAELEYNIDSCSAVARLSTSADESAPGEWGGPNHSALHEALHLLLARLHTHGKWRYVTPDQLNNEEEGIVRILEKAFSSMQ